MVGKVTINGKEYRLMYGMMLSERISELVVTDKDGKVIKSPTTIQTLRRVIYNGHENWCDDNREPFDLEWATVVEFIDNAYSAKDQKELSVLGRIADEWVASQRVDDLIKPGSKEVEDKKKQTGTILSESPTESSD